MVLLHLCNAFTILCLTFPITSVPVGRQRQLTARFDDGNSNPDDEFFKRNLFKLNASIPADDLSSDSEAATKATTVIGAGSSVQPEKTWKTVWHSQTNKTTIDDGCPSVTGSLETSASAAGVTVPTTTAMTGASQTSIGDEPERSKDTGLISRYEYYVLFCYASIAICVTYLVLLITCCRISKNDD